MKPLDHRGSACDDETRSLVLDPASCGPASGSNSDDSVRWLLRNCGQSPSAAAEFSRFQIERMLGEGGYGTVYLARDTGPLQREVAIKVLKPKLAADPAEVERFVHEGRTAAQLQHEHIVAVYEIGVPAPFAMEPFIVFEYVAGTNLREQLPRHSAEGKPPSFPTLAAIRQSAARLADIVEAIQYAHQKGIAHRDLKPANILVDAQGVWRVTDFGLSGGAPTLGTPLYTSPEQAAQQADLVGPASDIYSLGVVLYQLLTGVTPFRGSSAEVLEQVRRNSPVPPRQRNSAVSRDLELICLKALEKSAEMRYSSAGAMADDLRRWLRHEPISLTSSPVYKTRKLVRRHWQVSIGLLAVFLSILAGLMTTAFWYRKAEERAEANANLATARQAALTEKETALADKQTALTQKQAALAESTYTLAHAQMQRGRWREALVSLEACGSQSRQDSAELQLDAARCLLAFDEADEARKILDTLGDQPLSREQEAVLNLLRGELELGNDNVKAVELILAAVDRGLSSPVDQAYAQALIAPTVNESLNGLRKVLDLDPAHHRANLLAVMTLYLTGLHSEAGNRLAKAQAFYPEDARLWLIELLLVDEREPQRALVIRNRALQVLEPAVVADFDLVADVVRQSREVIGRMAGGNRLLGNMEFLKAGSRVAPILAGRPGARGLGLSMPPQLQRSYGRFLKGMFWPGLRLENLASAAELALREHDDGFFHMALGLRSMLALEDAASRLKSDDRIDEGTIERSRIGIGELSQAATVPCMFPIREIALKSRFALRTLLWVSTGRNDDALLRSAADDVKMLESEFGMRTLLPVNAGHSEDLFSFTQVALLAGEYAIAERLLSVWHASNPGDRFLPFCRGLSYKQRGEHLAAAAAFRHFLSHLPSNGDVSTIISEAEVNLCECMSQISADEIEFVFPTPAR